MAAPSSSDCPQYRPRHAAPHPFLKPLGVDLPALRGRPLNPAEWLPEPLSGSGSHSAGLSGRPRSAGKSTPSGFRNGCGAACLGRYWGQSEDEGAAISRDATYEHVASMAAGQGPADGEPEARSLGAAGVVSTVETVKDALMLCRRDPWPLVGNRNLDPAVRRGRHLHADGCTGRTVSGCIVQQVHD